MRLLAALLFLITALAETPQRLVLRKVQVVPDEFPVKAKLQAAGLIDQLRARSIASEFQSQLLQHGYVGATVQPELAVVSPGRADLLLQVTAGPAVHVKQVRLIGNTGLDRDDVLGTMKAIRSKRILPGIPGVWRGWITHPPYSAMALDSDLARLRSLYLSRGFFDASVLLDHTSIADGKATITLRLEAGPQFRVREWRAARSHRRVRDFCRCLFDLRREAEKDGVLDFAARAGVRPAGTSPRDVDVVAGVESGPRYTVRRIDFQGNRRFSDGLIRSNLLLDEAEPLDATLLRKSLDRINRSMLFEPLNESDVDVATDVKTGRADIRIRLTERKAGSWMLSGPVGPMSIAGPLQFALSSRLPAWGRGLFELSSYYATFSLTAYADPVAHILGWNPESKVLPVVALQRPFVPAHGWTSGFTIAPQLGWKTTALNYAATQLRERGLSRLSGGSLPAPSLQVIVERPDGNRVMFCETPEPRLKWLRKGAGIVLQIVAAMPSLV